MDDDDPPTGARSSMVVQALSSVNATSSASRRIVSPKSGRSQSVKIRRHLTACRSPFYRRPDITSSINMVDIRLMALDRAGKLRKQWHLVDCVWQE
jgi:hypothetical protein